MLDVIKDDKFGVSHGRLSSVDRRYHHTNDHTRLVTTATASLGQQIPMIITPAGQQFSCNRAVKTHHMSANSS